MSSPMPPVENYVFTGDHYLLYQRVKKLLYRLPMHFKSPLLLKGVAPADIFAAGGLVSAQMERGVVENLNNLRHLWDPEGNYDNYHFVRQSQTFPDVLLQHMKYEEDILLGIELKGWFILSREEMPSFRFTATPSVCAPRDLLVVFPWMLSEIVAGSLELLHPYIVESKYAAVYRNWYWEHGRPRSSHSASVILSTADKAYPGNKTEMSDRGIPDGGKNWGRLARTPLMRSYIKEMLEKTAKGKTFKAWIHVLDALDKYEEVEGDLGMTSIEQVMQWYDNTF